MVVSHECALRNGRHNKLCMFETVGEIYIKVDCNGC